MLHIFCDCLCTLPYLAEYLVVTEYPIKSSWCLPLSRLPEHTQDPSLNCRLLTDLLLSGAIETSSPRCRVFYRNEAINERDSESRESAEQTPARKKVLLVTIRLVTALLQQGIVTRPPVSCVRNTTYLVTSWAESL